MSPAVSMGCWSIFQRNLVRLADFAGSEFQRMANWPNFDLLIETGRLFRTGIIILVSIFLSKLGQLAVRWNLILQKRPIPLDSARKLTSSSLKQKGTLLTSPGEKSCQSVQKIFLLFGTRTNCRPQEPTNSRELRHTHRTPQLCAGLTE